MDFVELSLSAAGGIASIGVAGAIAGAPIQVVFDTLLPKAVADAFLRLLSAAVFFGAMLPAIGLMSRGYGYESEVSKNIDWFQTFYSSFALGGMTVLSILGVTCFTTLVLHVGLVRARIEAGAGEPASGAREK